MCLLVSVVYPKTIQVESIFSASIQTLNSQLLPLFMALQDNKSNSKLTTAMYAALMLLMVLISFSFFFKFFD